jgi:glutamate synthase (NADPH/NADH) small chain
MAEKKDRQPMSNRSISERIKDFEEVPIGYSVDQAVEEASRCIQCKNPKCRTGCPVDIDIPGFLAKVVQKDFDGAVKKIKETNALPAICGRVCPQEDQCEKACILGVKGQPVAIGNMERFVADRERNAQSVMRNAEEKKAVCREPLAVSSFKKIAIVGSGPAGLTCAGDLARLGYSVTIFESLHVTGGVLTYGIPEFRLPKSIVNLEIEYIESLGVEIKTDMIIGNVLSIEELLKEYQAVFIASGAGLPKFMGIPGEALDGVYSANEFLFRVNMMKAYKFPEALTPIKVGKKVAVIGSGNVAMDAARVSLRLGAEEVSIIYRRSREEMPARLEEVKHAEEEGIDFRLLTNPERYIPNDKNWVGEVECIRMELGEPDSSGRRRPVPLKDSNFRIPVDTVVVAIGNGPNPLIPRRTPDLKMEKWGGLIITPDQMTSISNVYAGGDIVRGAATVISAMGDGKKAAKSIHSLLTK